MMGQYRLTGMFVAINTMIRLAREDSDIERVIQDVFPMVTAEVKDNKYRMICSDALSLDEWEDYFSDVHSLDHATEHNIFTDRGHRLLTQLECLFGLSENSYEQSEDQLSQMYKRDYRTLFKYSKASESYFLRNYEHHSNDIWIRKRVTT